MEYTRTSEKIIIIFVLFVKLLSFLNQVKESNLRGVWTKEAVAREKDKAIEAKQKQLEDAFEYEAKEKVFKVEIDGLEKKLNESRNEIIELKSQLGYVGNKLKETEDKFRADFGVQMKYNAANENSMKKLEQKIEERETTLGNLEQRLAEVLHMPERKSERDQMKRAEYRFSFLEEDFSRFVDKYRLLQEVEKQYDQLLHERDYILAHLGHHASENKPSLLNAYRDFAVKADEDMLTMKQQIEKNSHVIENQQEKILNLNKEVETHTEQKKMKQAGTVWQNAMMGVMRKQLNDVKYENRMKDTRIKHYEGEVTKLKAKIAELESQRREEGPLSHRHAHQHHHQVVSPERNRMEDADDDSSKGDSKSRRNTLLPPLGGRVLYQSAEPKPPSYQQIPSPTRAKPKGQKSMWQQNVALPEGLITHQLRLEHRASEDMHSVSPTKMPQGYGNLKVMHGKPSKYAHVRT